MFCRNCGNELQAGDKFCSKCGAKTTPDEELNVINEEKKSPTAFESIYDKKEKAVSEVPERIEMDWKKQSESKKIVEEKPDMHWDMTEKPKARGGLPDMHWDMDEKPKAKSGLPEMDWSDDIPKEQSGNEELNMVWEKETNRKTTSMPLVWDTEEIPKEHKKSDETFRFDWSSVVDDKERRASKKVPTWRTAISTNLENEKNAEARKEEVKEVFPWAKPTEEPIVEPEPIIEEPIIEEAVIVEPEPIVEEIVVEPEPIIAEAIIEEVVIEEPEPIIEEAIIEEDVIEEPEPIIEEPIIEEEVIEEPEPIILEPVIEEAVIVEPEPIVEEIVVEPEPIIEEPVEEPEYVSPFDEDDKLDSELRQLELELFAEMEDNYVNRDATIKVDKFYTLDKKSEEFQSLLDNEYEKIKKKGANYDLMETVEEENDYEPTDFELGAGGTAEAYGLNKEFFKNQHEAEIQEAPKPKEVIKEKEFVMNKLPEEIKAVKEVKEEEEEKEEQVKKKSHKVLKFFVVLLLILVVFEIFVLAMNNFAPNNIVTEQLNNGIRQVTDLLTSNLVIEDSTTQSSLTNQA